MNHLFVTQDYPPDLGGMARRHEELVRRYPEPMTVLTAASDPRGAVDPRVERVPLTVRQGATVLGQARWAGVLTRRCKSRVDVLHCGNIRPTGYSVWWAHRRLSVPYFVYVNGGDLLREGVKARKRLKRWSARLVLGDAAGIIANSSWCAGLATEIMGTLGVMTIPPVAAIDLGADPEMFRPDRDTGQLRSRLGLEDAVLMTTIARLVPHKGQDMGIRAVAALRAEFPTLHYLVVGEGHDESRLRRLATDLEVGDRVHFPGPLRDDALPEVYATSDLYLGLSRVDNEINVEGFGIAFSEASASGLPIVAGDSGGVRSAVRDGETGLIVDPRNLEQITSAIRRVLANRDLAETLGGAGRRAVESHYNWDRVARETAAFVRKVLGDTPRSSSRQ